MACCKARCFEAAECAACKACQEKRSVVNGYGALRSVLTAFSAQARHLSSNRAFFNEGLAHADNLIDVSY
ncbi:hypothetical protein D3C77_653200 [compost metagenome]